MLLLFLLYSFGVFSQKKFSKELRFITDNDLYTSTYDDRYYTSGLFLSFSYLSKEKKEALEGDQNLRTTTYLCSFCF